MDAKSILNVTLEPNDSGATTIRGYLAAIVREVWDEGECFSGKRPFGNSGWERDVYRGLVHAGFVQGTFDEDGYLELSDDEQQKAQDLIFAAINEMANPPQ